MDLARISDMTLNTGRIWWKKRWLSCVLWFLPPLLFSGQIDFYYSLEATFLIELIFWTNWGFLSKCVPGSHRHVKTHDPIELMNILNGWPFIISSFCMSWEATTFGNVTFLKSEGALLLCYGASLLLCRYLPLKYRLCLQKWHFKSKTQINHEVVHACCPQRIAKIYQPIKSSGGKNHKTQESHPSSLIRSERFLFL